MNVDNFNTILSHYLFFWVRESKFLPLRNIIQKSMNYPSEYSIKFRNVFVARHW